MTIEQRLTKLERQNKWMKRAGGLTLACVACVVLMGQGRAADPDRLSARSLTLVDENGKMRIFLGVAPNGNAKIQLYDSKTRRMSLLVQASGVAWLNVCDKDGRQLLRLAVEDNDLPGLAIWDKEFKLRIGIGLEPGSKPLAYIADKAGKKLWTAPPR